MSQYLGESEKKLREVFEGKNHGFLMGNGKKKIIQRIIVFENIDEWIKTRKPPKTSHSDSRNQKLKTQNQVKIRLIQVL